MARATAPTEDLNSVDLIDTERYPIADPQSPAFARVVEAARQSYDAEGLALLPGFLKADARRQMITEAEAAIPRSHRRDISFGIYRDESLDRPPEGHPALRKNPFSQWVIAADLLPEHGALRSLFRAEPMVAFVGALVGETLYCSADPLAACNVTVMREGDQHGWHFDANDFVVSLLLEKSSGGGQFEVRPGTRTESGIDHDAVAAAFSGTDGKIRRPPVEEGTLSIFRGQRSLHRVSPVSGGRRMIALFSYDRRPGMLFSDQVRLGAFGRAS
ncbi:MAG: 2OG-Fe(II) oxygenase [Hyphomicrobiaceae bacterium]